MVSHVFKLLKLNSKIVVHLSRSGACAVVRKVFGKFVLVFSVVLLCVFLARSGQQIVGSVQSD